MRSPLDACFMAALLRAKPALAAPVDFTGNWMMDEDASTSLEPVFQLRGVPWARRKLAEGLDESQDIKQSGHRVSIGFDNIVGRMEQKLVADGATMSIDALLVAASGEKASGRRVFHKR